MATKECYVCKKVDAEFVCSKCKAVRYCSKECQRADWIKEHKLRCDELKKTTFLTKTLADPCRRGIINVEDICAGLWEALLNISSFKASAESSETTSMFKFMPVGHYGRYYDTKRAIEFWYTEELLLPQEEASSFSAITDATRLIIDPTLGRRPGSIAMAHTRNVDLVIDKNGVLTRFDALAKIATGKCDVMSIGLACAIVHLNRHGFDIAVDKKRAKIAGTFHVPVPSAASRTIEVYADPSIILEDDWPLGKSGQADYIGWHQGHRAVGFFEGNSEKTVEFVVDPTAVQNVRPENRTPGVLGVVWPCVVGAAFPGMRMIDNAEKNAPENVIALANEIKDVRPLMAYILARMVVAKLTTPDEVMPLK